MEGSGHEGHVEEGGREGYMGACGQGTAQPLCWVGCGSKGQLMLTCTPTLMYPYPVPWGVPETPADPYTHPGVWNRLGH